MTFQQKTERPNHRDFKKPCRGQLEGVECRIVARGVGPRPHARVRYKDRDMCIACYHCITQRERKRAKKLKEQMTNG